MSDELVHLEDSFFMGLALKQAKEAAELGDVPIGAVLVLDGVVYASGNRREEGQDPTAHAEVMALRHASEQLGQWRLDSSSLYVTTEPCVMCTGALYLARVKRVIFGCVNPKGGALRFIGERERELNLNHHIDVTSGVREVECAQLLKDFFRDRRLENSRRAGRVVEGA